jgi:hypothetical protein
MAITKEPKIPGELRNIPGTGNEDFDKGLKKSKFGYPIWELFELPIEIEMGIDEKLEWQCQGPLYPTPKLINSTSWIDLLRLF